MNMARRSIGFGSSEVGLEAMVFEEEHTSSSHDRLMQEIMVTQPLTHIPVKGVARHTLVTVLYIHG
jgi:hypothetical protein